MSQTDTPRTVPVFDPTRPLTPGALLLEASAGTGKTYNITNLVVRLVAEVGVDLEEILVVTFTRAATAELRDRIRRRLTQASQACEQALADPTWEPDRDVDAVLHHLVATARAGDADRLRTRWRRLVDALESFDDATISTIHGFCQETLRHSAFESDADFDAELVEDVDDLLEAITHDFVVRELRHADPDWYAHLRACRVNRDELVQLARRIEAEPHLHILPTEPLADPEQTLLDAVARCKDAWRAERDQIVTWLRAQRDAGTLSIKRYRESMDASIDAIDEWCDGVAARFADLKKDAPVLRPDRAREADQGRVRRPRVLRAARRAARARRPPRNRVQGPVRRAPPPRARQAQA